MEACLPCEFLPASTFHQGGCPLENVQVAESIEKSKSSTRKKLKTESILSCVCMAFLVAGLGLCSLLVHTAGVLSTASYGQDRPAILQHWAGNGSANVQRKVKLALGSSSDCIQNILGWPSVSVSLSTPLFQHLMWKHLRMAFQKPEKESLGAQVLRSSNFSQHRYAAGLVLLHWLP